MEFYEVETRDKEKVLINLDKIIWLETDAKAVHFGVSEIKLSDSSFDKLYGYMTRKYRFLKQPIVEHKVSP